MSDWLICWAAVELAEGRPVRGQQAEELAEAMRLVAQHKVDGAALPAAVELRFAALVLALAAARPQEVVRRRVLGLHAASHLGYARHSDEWLDGTGEPLPDREQAWACQLQQDGQLPEFDRFFDGPGVPGDRRAQPGPARGAAVDRRRPRAHRRDRGARRRRGRGGPRGAARRLDPLRRPHGYQLTELGGAQLESWNTEHGPVASPAGTGGES